MFSESKVTEIFFMADEFCKVYERMMSKSSVKTADLPKKRKYHRASTLLDAEIMVILILFHSSGYRCLNGIRLYPSEPSVPQGCLLQQICGT